ncbi:uroporphyrinogen-III synthase [Amycolatopsis sp. CA-230715]|uniref:uroporphyrinogen-III synthase n=1 Tax=Amycolatopsis sp. CA-230715 TaxID=2745196 RepID=UPI001C00A64B|nr:uroporphyrinogen-III synthase [Amycolatopsis sp. CA-230715]QWF79150.1 hypothetical protein HUW46_02557 [Amycolatopsis sp. CA-230715]
MRELDGVTIGITAERRAEEFTAALERHGATVWHAPAIRIVPLPDDERLREATEDILARPVAFTAVTTGAGFRGWAEAAEGWGLREQLVTALGGSRIFARGPKACGAVRGAGLREEYSSKEETNAELFGELAKAGVDGARVAVQLHGSPLPEHTSALSAAGAEVVEVQPYRWLDPAEPERVFALIDGVLDGRVRALAFTSAPAAANFLNLARVHGVHAELLTALRSGPVTCACVGAVTAAPLADFGVPTVQPDRQRLGALVKLLVSLP